MKNFKQTAYDRFVRYASFETTSDINSEKSPSTETQREFSKMLAQELKELGLIHITTDQFAITMAEIPANTDQKLPTIGFIAHMDTVADYKGSDIKPQLHKNYDGGTLIINQEKGMKLSPQTQPSLKKCIGHDLVTSDGTTILAADDKIGIAIMMTLAQYLQENPDIKHGPIKYAFTIDEEIGAGIVHFDVARFGADFAYTIDGGAIGDIDYGNFNGDRMTIEIAGRNGHPGSAKDFMENPVRIAADIITAWPVDRLPETTEGEQGFILFKDITADLEKAKFSAIVRDHDLKKLEEHEAILEGILAQMRKKYPNSKITSKVDKQYRNMKDVLRETPRALDVLEAALKAEKVEYQLTQARGGTDGARLSFKGLPTPNIFAGYENAHGPYEWMSLDWAEKAFNVCLRILQEVQK